MMGRFYTLALKIRRMRIRYRRPLQGHLAWPADFHLTLLLGQGGCADSQRQDYLESL